MKRDCNLELRLVTPSSSSSSDFAAAPYHSSMFDDDHHMEEKVQPMTIFYNGRVASYDATELQARAIIFFASKEMEGKSNNNNSPGPSPCSQGLNSPMISSPTASHSMKRSLQRFLEKRNARAQPMSPYPNPIVRHNNHSEN